MEQVKKLYRSRKNRVIGGVCGGIAEYFNVDPVIIRVLFVALAIADGIGILIYIVLMIVLPDENKIVASSLKENIEGVANEIKEGVERTAADMKESRWIDNKRNIIGLLIIVVGGILLLNQFMVIRWLRWDYVWPVVIIAIGFFIIVRHKR